ncbi:MAG: hypothetical protein U0694_09425 [Anaerolineae bacterium]
MKLILITFAVLLTCCIVLAQEDQCLDVMREAIEAALEHCAMMDSNELCYASGAQEIAARADSETPYSEPGDLIGTGLVDVLAMTSSAEAPAIALLTPRANFVRGQVHMVALGNVSLQNLGNWRSDFVAADAAVARRNGAQIFTQPDVPTDGYLCWGCAVRAVGRSADGLWLLVLREDDSSVWVAAVDMEAAFDFALLPVVAADTVPEPPFVGAMQAFKLISGVDDAPCAGMFESGLLVQAPNVEPNALLVVNGLQISFDGTLFLQAQPDAAMIVSVLEGTALLGTGEEAFTLNVGERLAYPFNGQTLGVHGLPETYHYAAARNLPSYYLLPRAFELPFSTGGLLTPYIEGALASVTPEDACTIAWTVDINLRAGPGTNFPIREGVAANFSATPDGRANGTDGALWWRLADGIWLNANNTIAAGACGTLPIIDVLEGQ